MPGQALFLETDEGVSGISFGGGAMVSQIVEHVLLGEDPRGVRGLWNRMVDYVFKGGHRGEAAAAVSALDIALWDLKARLNGEPLWKTLGASSPKVRAYASGIDSPLPDDQLDAFYRSMAARGVCGGKLKCGLDLEADLRRIGIMRDALACSGQRPELCIDVNEYWSPKQAIRYMHVIEEQFGITWIE